MKKLLVLVMVLSLASIANAGLANLSIDGATATDGTEEIGLGTTIDLYVMGGTTGYLYDITSLKAETTLGYPVVSSNAGGLGGVTNNYSDDTVWDYELNAGSVTGDQVAGIHFTMDLSSSLGLNETFVVDLYEYGVGNVDSITFTVTPEPITLALLGLGGLFIRRKS